MEAYRNNLEHLQDEFQRLNLLLARAVREFRVRRAGGGTGPFPGLVISDEEIDQLIAGTPTPDEFWSVTDRLATFLRAQIQEREMATQSRGIFLRLPHLIKAFDLDVFEADLLVLALLPHYSRRYQRLYAFLQDDVGNIYPTVELALQLFCVTDGERIDARQYFAKTRPLFQNQLLDPFPDDESSKPALLNCQLIVDQRIADFLFGSDRLEAKLEGARQACRWVQPLGNRTDLVLADNVSNLMNRVVAIIRSNRPLRCLLHGPEGSGKKTFAETVCAETGHRLLVVDLASADTSNPTFRRFLQSAFREARLYNAAIYLDSWQQITPPADGNGLQVAETLIAGFPGHVFLGSRTAWRARQAPGILSVEVPLPDEDLRRSIWEARLRDTPAAGDCDTLQLAGSFRFTPGQIEAALTRAESIRLLRAGDDSELTMCDLLTGCRAQSSIDLVSFARKLEPKRGWPDLVLPKDTLAQLHEFCQQVRHRAHVFDSWGFGRKLTLAKGFMALFSGSSGTGKTLSAEVLANDLGLDLYRVDLSCVVSKYIGETEKNLSRVFDDAQMSNAILFFDEADALFGKRSEVKDAHDRYANIEINYLLQRVEEYEGVVILASNLSNNIDSAFIRRMRFCIELPFPDEAHRRRIWRGVFPSQTPVADDVDFDFLARKFKLAGGNIQNVALAAAFSAADNGGKIGMEHLVLALKREYQKLGRVCERADFEHYYDLVR